MTRRRPLAVASTLVSVGLLAVCCGASSTAGDGATGGGAADLPAAILPGIVTTPGSRTIHVTGAGLDFTSTLPASAVATYVVRPGASAVQETLTSTTGALLDARMSRQPDLHPSTATPSGATTIAVDRSRSHQKVVGFGGALPESAATLIQHSPHRTAILHALFGKAHGKGGGARLDVVRLPMGGTDLESGAAHSYDDSAKPDPHLRRFSVGQDRAATIPVLHAVRARQPRLKLLATPWSAPGWMKVGGTFDGTCGGRSDDLRGSAYGPYADYFLRFAQAYAHLGLPVWMFSLGNEPEVCSTSYPTMTMGPTQEARLARVLRARLDHHGLRHLQLLAYDHNHYDASGPGGASAPSTYPARVLAHAHGAVGAIGYHCYDDGGNADASATQVRGIATLMTECSGSIQEADAAQNLVTEVRDDLIGPLRNGARTALYWSLAQGTDGGPHQGGCATCRGMIGIDRSTGSWSPDEDYYYWSQFSSFIAPGARRIDSTDLGVGNLETVAFRNPSGTIVLVVLNGTPTTDVTGSLVVGRDDTSASPTAWYVALDGTREWVPDTATFACLKAAGVPGPVRVSAAVLADHPDDSGVWAVCDAQRMGQGSVLVDGASVLGADGSRLTLSQAALTLTDAAGRAVWSSHVGGDTAELDAVGDLVVRRAGRTVWSSRTGGEGAADLAVSAAHGVVLLDSLGQAVWTSLLGPLAPVVGATH